MMPASSPPSSAPAPRGGPAPGTQPLPETRIRRFVFVLLDRFTLLSFAAAIDPLRLANRVSGKTLYEWRVIGPDGHEATASNGTRILLDGGLEALQSGDTALVCGGVGISDAVDRKLLDWLRREERRGVILGGLCTGAWALAKAGLLNGRPATIHWENNAAFAEAFPDVTLYRSIFVDDGNRLTAAGGAASVDLMLRLIASDHGGALATTVADQLIYTTIRTAEDTQRLSIPTRIGVRHPRLAQVVARMEETIEEPVSPSILAEEAGMSTRQLERLFRRYLGRSPKRYYMETRLARARNLLMQTQMSVIEVALACGFSSPSHFSKCYRIQYGSTPYRERGTGSAAKTGRP